MKRATFKQLTEKDFRVFLGNNEIGKSSNEVDARFHMNAINDALDVAYLEGQQYLERMVMRKRQEVELGCALIKGKHENELLAEALREEHEEAQENAPRQQQQTSGPTCKKCGKFTTYARAESHGMCMKCETETRKANAEAPVESIDKCSEWGYCLVHKVVHYEY